MVNLTVLSGEVLRLLSSVFCLLFSFCSLLFLLCSLLSALCKHFSKFDSTVLEEVEGISLHANQALVLGCKTSYELRVLKLISIVAGVRI